MNSILLVPYPIYYKYVILAKQTRSNKIMEKEKEPYPNSLNILSKDSWALEEQYLISFEMQD